MSSLKERLGRLKKSGAAEQLQGSEASVVTSEGGALASDGTSAISAAAAAEVTCDIPEARIEENEWGTFIVRERQFPLGHVHGLYALGELEGCSGTLAVMSGSTSRRSGSHAAAKPGNKRSTMAAAPGISSIADCLESGQLQHDRILFIDTETTGLGLGAGNVPFMIGLGYYTAESFVVEQLFMRNPAEERAMLTYLQNLLRRFDFLVSYNGKSFDWPIVTNRYVMNRLKLEDRHLLHLDFLYASRSLWKHSLESCRLGIVEEKRLNIRRTDDVPGSLAPTLYFRYLADRRGEGLHGVFVHNESDILTLAQLAIHMAKLLSGECPLETMETEDVYRLGVWLHKWGRDELAELAFAKLLERSAVISGYMLPVAAIYKKQRHYAKAVQLWSRAVDENLTGRSAGIDACVELAMYYEHHVKDAETALHYTEAALERAYRKLSMSRGDAKARLLIEALQKRQERLRAKGSSESYLF